MLRLNSQKEVMPYWVVASEKAAGKISVHTALFSWTEQKYECWNRAETAVVGWQGRLEFSFSFISSQCSFLEHVLSLLANELCLSAKHGSLVLPHVCCLNCPLPVISVKLIHLPGSFVNLMHAVAISESSYVLDLGWKVGGSSTHHWGAVAPE